MKTVPLNDGTVPLRTSKNPVLGVFRHHCGEIATVHQPKGRRSKTRYLICDHCGTDQCGGVEYQADIKAKTYPTIEALQAVTSAVYTASEPAVKEEPEAEPVLSENEADKKTLETASNTVPAKDGGLTVVIPAEVKQPVSEKAPLTAASKVSTVHTIPDQAEPKLNDPVVNDAKPLRVGFAAVLGGLIGGLLAAVA